MPFAATAAVRFETRSNSEHRRDVTSDTPRDAICCLDRQKHPANTRADPASKQGGRNCARSRTRRAGLAGWLLAGWLARWPTEPRRDRVRNFGFSLVWLFLCCLCIVSPAHVVFLPQCFCFFRSVSPFLLVLRFVTQRHSGPTHHASTRDGRRPIPPL